ncbi:hypothetical protein DE146DRAFT_789374 [Phaeosphaeria sp. MPI-PUGE-AT-0046c]|nr:hypothetical protein DE146DRAFT_789374 [Phaeosphaeria sp. MPI-PUGE-AT-0046c]
MATTNRSALAYNARPPPYDQLIGNQQRPSSTCQPAFHSSRSPPYIQHHYSTTETFASTTVDKPMDLTQRLERKLAEYNASQNIFKRWLFEILSWLIAAVCMGSIVGIYIWAKDTPMSQAGNFLTYTNVLGKVASAALIVPTSEALGQLKWNWFQSSKAMWDFEIFDKPSRGPLGAALLLYRTKGRSLAALGALLIMLLLAIDTFFQQVVDFPERRVLEAAGSSLPRVVQYDPGPILEYFQGYEMAMYDSVMYPAVEQFLYKNGTRPVAFGNGTRPDIPLLCPTSTCTWPAYETLGVCSACEDASDLLEFKCLYTKIDWTSSYLGRVNPRATPNGTVCGYFYTNSERGPYLMSGYVVNGTNQSHPQGEVLLARTFPFTEMTTNLPISGGSVKFKHVRNPILDALIVSSVSTNDVYSHKPPVAQECVLSWCVKTLESAYESGHYTETIKSTYENNTRGTFPWESYELPVVDGVESWWTIFNQNITIDRRTAAPNASNAVIFDNIYKVDNLTASMVMLIFEQVFPSYYTESGTPGNLTLRLKDYWKGAKFRKMDFFAWQAPNNVTHHMERLAISMTNLMRSVPGTTVMLEGAAYNQVTFVSIRWAWLSFPFLLLILSLVFLAATIVKTSKDGAAGVWKTSAMPTLIYGLPKETQKQLTSPTTWRSGNGGPRKTRIKLLPNLGWRVSGQSLLNRSPRLPSGERVPRGWI